MKLSYDRQEDILYFHLKDGSAQTVEEVEDNVIVELDEDRKVMGIELWGVKKRGLLKDLSEIAISH